TWRPPHQNSSTAANAINNIRTLYQGHHLEEVAQPFPERDTARGIVDLAIIDKRREGPNVSEVMNIIGEVEGKTAIILDDMIDTAGTVTQAAQALMDHGAKDVYACCTHPVLSGPAMERLEKSCITELVVTDTIPIGADKASKKIKVLSTGDLLGNAIKRIHFGQSVSSLFV
ncbi:MAG: ribose-phosphate diphosphokinase, partial [Thermodesulfobacteriota bacterium]